MSNPTFKLPSGYASLKWGTPLSFTEGTYFSGLAIMKGIKYSNGLERIKIEGSTGFVAGFVDMKAASAGAGGTKFDTEKVTMSFVHGEHSSRAWATPGDVLTISGCTGTDTVFNGSWSVMNLDLDFARKSEADIAYQLERYCDVALT